MPAGSWSAHGEHDAIGRSPGCPIRFAQSCGRHYDDRRLGIAEGARMVTRAEFESALPIGSIVAHVVAKLLALAADESGRIANYEPGESFDQPVLAAMEMEPDDVTTPSATTPGLRW